MKTKENKLFKAWLLHGMEAMILCCFKSSIFKKQPGGIRRALEGV